MAFQPLPWAACWSCWSSSPHCVPRSEVLLLNPAHQGMTRGCGQEWILVTQPCCCAATSQDTCCRGRIRGRRGDLSAVVSTYPHCKACPGAIRVLFSGLGICKMRWGFATLPSQGSLWWGWGDTMLPSSVAVLKLATLLTSVWTQWYLVNNTWLVHAGVWFGNCTTAFN